MTNRPRERVTLIAELSTNHGGDVALAERMIVAAAQAGADVVKVQHYSEAAINLHDPQADWLRKSRLSERDLSRLAAVCRRNEVRLMVTPFDRWAISGIPSGAMIKIAGTEAWASWWRDHEIAPDAISWPWGHVDTTYVSKRTRFHLVAVPLYPTPLEAVDEAMLRGDLNGYSDHTPASTGIAAACHMISRGAEAVEMHMCLDGEGRRQAWDRTPEWFADLRAYADRVVTIATGIGATFRERWRR